MVIPGGYPKGPSRRGCFPFKGPFHGPFKGGFPNSKESFKGSFGKDAPFKGKSQG